MSEPLIAIIESYRTRLVQLVKEYGLTDPKTITCSQELDFLLNKLEHTKQTKRTNVK